MVDVKTINPLMVCSKCNDGRLHLENCLTDKYIKSKKFKITAPSSWKYLYNLIPFHSKNSQSIDYDIGLKSVISLNEGGTPLRVSNIGPKFNLKSLRIKDETRNPTTTYMDRGTSAEISVCRWLSSSTKSQNIMAGNIVGRLAVSLAAYSARAGFECELFVQSNQQEWGLSPNILYQLISYGAKINLNSKKIVLPSNYYMFNYNNTFFVEGLKTIGFEICDQLDWELPDHIIVPMGQGTLIYAIYQSLRELLSLGMVQHFKSRKKKVKIHGVTLEKNLFLHNEDFNSFNNNNNNNDTKVTKNNNDSDITLQTTLLDKQKQIATIAPELIPPIRHSYLNDAELAIHNSGGSIIKVSDNDLINAVSLLASNDGIFASPAGASSIAGLLKLIESNVIDNQDENIICIVTMSEGSTLDSTKNWKILQSYNRLKNQKKPFLKSLYTFEKNDGMNDNILLLGNTKTKIVLLLKEYPDYAYNLQKRLNNKYSMSLDISTLYQHLNELEKMGVIVRSKAESIRGKPIRFYYSITPTGNSLT
jgi:threonine synthase